MKIRDLVKEKFLYILVFAIALFLIISCLISIISNGFGFIDYKDSFGKEHSGKVLWDWLDLLIVPLFLTFAIYLYTNRSTDREKALELDRQREKALQDFYDYVEGILDDDKSKLQNYKIGMLQARAHSTFRMLDGFRKGLLLMFLYDTGLIQQNRDTNAVISLANADLSELKLFKITPIKIHDSLPSLSRVDFTGVNLRKASLQNISISDSIFSKADLTESSLEGCVINNCCFREANLSNSNITGARIYGSIFLKSDFQNANLSSVHFDDKCIFYDSDFANPIDPIIDRANFSGSDLSKAVFYNDILPSQVKSSKNFGGACLPGGLVLENDYSLFKIEYAEDPDFNILETAHPGMGFHKIIIGRCGCGKQIEPLYQFERNFRGFWYGYIAHLLSDHVDNLYEHESYGGRDFKTLIEAIKQRERDGFYKM